MKYVGYKNQRGNKPPRFHRVKNEAPLCGEELTERHYVREGLPEEYTMCPACNIRHGVINTVQHHLGGWTQERLAAENIRRCQEYRRGP